MDEKITLDLKSFKALASETRVSILKKLGLRRATASEVAGALGVSVQAASEHLEKMREAGIVARVESPPRKWVYYELTEKGRALLHPEAAKKKIWVLLTVGALAVVAGFSRLMVSLFGFIGSCSTCGGGGIGANAPAAAPAAAPAVLGAAKEAVQAVQVSESSQAASAAGIQPLLSSWEILLLAFGALAFGCGLFFLLKRRKELRELEKL